jgi:hypothetical protein
MQNEDPKTDTKVYTVLGMSFRFFQAKVIPRREERRKHNNKAIDNSAEFAESQHCRTPHDAGEPKQNC